MKIPNRETLRRWLVTADAPVFFQIAKYGVCGLLGTATLAGIAMLLSATVIPAFEGKTIGHEPITDAMRQRHLVINNLIAFPFANLVTYWLNRRFVFIPGRHSLPVEFTIFTSITGLSFLAGLFGGPLLIKRYGISTPAAQLSLILTSALVNFICRKLVVFAR